MPYSYSREQELSNNVWSPLLPLNNALSAYAHTGTQQQRDTTHTSPFVHIVLRNNNALGVLRVYLCPRGQSLRKGPMHYVHV